MLILSIMAIIDYIFLFFELHYVHLGVLVSAVGITASILIFEKKRVGVILALIWSALQFLSLQIDSFGFNFIQFLDLRFYFSIFPTPIKPAFQNLLLRFDDKPDQVLIHGPFFF